MQDQLVSTQERLETTKRKVQQEERDPSPAVLRKEFCFTGTLVGVTGFGVLIFDHLIGTGVPSAWYQMFLRIRT